MKMDWACILLAESHLNISEVARRVGYEDAFYFSKVFKTHLGLSPRAWKNQRIGQKNGRE
jgi:AraC-like DNA-binding protein